MRGKRGKEIKGMLREKFKDEGWLTTNDVRLWLEDQGLIHYDMEAIRIAHGNRVARSLIASLRDADGVRECFGFTVAGQRYFAFSEYETQEIVLDAQLAQVSKKWRGYAKSIKKLKKCKADLYEQLRMLVVPEVAATVETTTEIVLGQ